jgi:hypothetical protein
VLRNPRPSSPTGWCSGRTPSLAAQSTGIGDHDSESHECSDVERAHRVIEFKLGVETNSSQYEFVKCAFQLVLDGEEEGKLAENIDICAEVVRCLAQSTSVMENCVDLRGRLWKRGRERALALGIYSLADTGLGQEVSFE